MYACANSFTTQHTKIQYNPINTHTGTHTHTHTYIQAQMHQNKDTPNLLHSYQYGLIKKILTLLSFESSTMVLDVQLWKIQICEKNALSSFNSPQILPVWVSHLHIVLGKCKQLTVVWLVFVQNWIALNKSPCVLYITIYRKNAFLLLTYCTVLLIELLGSRILNFCKLDNLCRLEIFFSDNPKCMFIFHSLIWTIYWRKSWNLESVWVFFYWELYNNKKTSYDAMDTANRCHQSQMFTPGVCTISDQRKRATKVNEFNLQTLYPFIRLCCIELFRWHVFIKWNLCCFFRLTN